MIGSKCYDQKTIASTGESTMSETKEQDFSIDYRLSEIPSSKELKNRFKILSTIGLGGQAYVKEAIDLESKDRLALKIFNKKKMSFFALNAAHMEYSIIKKLQHENIIKAKSYFEDQDHILVGCELMSSDLKSLLVEIESPLRED